jgi:predicted nucleic acid-binding protein
MLVVDSSVWIDFFNARDSAARAELRHLLADGSVRLVMPDLVLYEVLRGFRQEGAMRQARQLLQALSVESCGGQALALEAAGHYRYLRARGITVRSALDVLIAAFCIANDYLLLHNDRDFDAFAAHRGLRVWGMEAFGG